MLMKYAVWKDIMPQSSYFKSRLDLVTLGGVEWGNLKSWKTLRVVKSEWNLVVKIIVSPRYVTGSALFGGFGRRRVNSEKLKKWGIFYLWRSDQILLKFDVWKDNVFQSSYFKSRPDPVTSGGVGGGKLKSWKTLRVEGSGWNLYWK